MNKELFMSEVCEHFLHYVSFDTKSVEDMEAYPSSEGQLVLGKELLKELTNLGLKNTFQDEHGYIFGTIPASAGCEKAPVVALFAHMDTSPEKSGKDIKPIIHKNYDGAPIVLTGGEAPLTIDPAKDANLAAKKGEDIITSDGSTLLGADDKAGVAEIMTLAAYLMKHPEVPHPEIRVVYTCDEEVGRGVDFLDLKKVNAHVGYTLDGETLGEIEGETFSADVAIITCRGFNTHPGYGKGQLINSIKLAAAFLELLPHDSLAPELTEGLEGFLHPYVIEGGIDSTTIKILLRDFEESKLLEYRALLNDIAAKVRARFPGGEVEVNVKEQYRNMREGLKKEPRAMALANKAVEMAGLTPVNKSIRGGTDGSRLTAMGLPTPNVFAGGHNFHSAKEWVSIQDMAMAVVVMLNMMDLWAKEQP